MKERKKSKTVAAKKQKSKVIPEKKAIKSTSANFDEFEKNVFKNVEPKNKLILAISGGPDSMYLLNRFLEIKKKEKWLQLKLIIAHINHGLRGKASDKDEEFVRKICKKNHLVFFSKKIHLKNIKKHSKNLEESGRKIRYEFFEQLRKRHKAQWIVTAHHLNDNIETMLFNLIRGAHLNGIKAMEVILPSRHLLRPMLGITKQEILAYLQKNKIEYCVDETNNDIEFSRNWLRKNIIPLFSKLNANFEKTFKETLKNIAETNRYLEERCRDWLKENSPIKLEIFLNEHHIFQKHLLVQLYKKVHGSTQKLTSRHLQEIMEMIQRKKANVKKEFGPGTFIEVVRDADHASMKTTKHTPEAVERGPNKKGVGSRGQNKTARYIRLSQKK